MTGRVDDWTALGEAVEGLALKLKLHFEQAADDTSDSLTCAVDEVGDAIDLSFDALRAAADDPAIKADVKDVATRLRDAVANTLSEWKSNRPADD